MAHLYSLNLCLIMSLKNDFCITVSTHQYVTQPDSKIQRLFVTFAESLYKVKIRPEPKIRPLGRSVFLKKTMVTCHKPNTKPSHQHNLPIAMFSPECTTTHLPNLNT